MNKKPVYFMQTDPKWKNKPYKVPGENDTIGKSGCGPSCAAMLITTITGKRFTPEDACNWSVEHGYKALNQGTYYSYFTPQFSAFGINCQMLNWQDSYHKPDHPNHALIEKKLKEGYYAIALMKKGHWTPGGHFVVLWWQDDKARILDPYSNRSDRLNGDTRTFRNEVKYYWLVDARKFNNPPKPKPVPPKHEEPKVPEKDDEVMEKRYNRFEELPDWSKPFVDRMIETGRLNGGDAPRDKNGRPTDMNLSLDMIRIIVMFAR